jgi:hypothetical protein
MLVVAEIEPVTCRVLPPAVGKAPIPMTPSVVSASKRVVVLAAFWILKAVVELLVGCRYAVPVLVTLKPP